MVAHILIGIGLELLLFWDKDTGDPDDILVSLVEVLLEYQEEILKLVADVDVVPRLKVLEPLPPVTSHLHVGLHN